MSIVSLDKERILNTIDLQDKMEHLEKNNLFSWDDCKSILDKYSERKSILKKVSEDLLLELNGIEDVHSIRIRIKDPVSLIQKIIVKKFENNEKYGSLTPGNYDFLVTDLIGARLILRFKHEWESVHKWLRIIFDVNRGEDDYAPPSAENVDFYKDKNESFRCFVEIPVAYYRSGDDDSIYSKENDNSIKPVQSKSHSNYRSIHYVIRYKNVFIEIQVRTIFEEAWGECNHELVYKQPEGTRKIMQKRSSDILSAIAHQGDEISSFMYLVSQGDLLNLPEGCEGLDCSRIKIAEKG
ncbi:MAG: RelA/SpoT domain-containing protein [Clostridiales Family XIII bacterium]|jgi:ppGpp synthetase/RelA/SpoT-type nucleotidyltranferase|nr:RelA/SpoT domain-containing protein [Clostridiales Family XIII bacterium]